jgi:hypothetical protein
MIPRAIHLSATALDLSEMWVDFGLIVTIAIAVAGAGARYLPRGGARTLWANLTAALSRKVLIGSGRAGCARDTTTGGLEGPRGAQFARDSTSQRLIRADGAELA